MNKLYINFRKAADLCLIDAEDALYKATGGKAFRKNISESVNVRKIKSNVKIISEDEESVTIAKTDKDGNILDENFRILSTTDLHVGDDEKRRIKTFSMLEKQIFSTKPDLVVFTGDIILSKYQHLDTLEFARFMEKTGVYWTIIFGNHEARENKGPFKRLIYELMKSYPHCLIKIGREDLPGYGNFVINILKSRTEIQKSLFLFDSGRSINDEIRKKYSLPDDLNGYDFIRPEQIKWYREKIRELKKYYGFFESFIYLHIPIPEYAQFIEKEGHPEFKFTGIGKVIYGHAYETVGCSDYNSGFYKAIKEEGSSKAMFAGHDHVNDFCVYWDGFYFVYSNCGGYETYDLGDRFGIYDEKKWPQGVTITDIKKDGSFEISQRFNSLYL